MPYPLILMKGLMLLLTQARALPGTPLPPPLLLRVRSCLGDLSTGWSGLESPSGASSRGECAVGDAHGPHGGRRVGIGRDQHSMPPSCSDHANLGSLFCASVLGSAHTFTGVSV